MSGIGPHIYIGNWEFTSGLSAKWTELKNRWYFGSNILDNRYDCIVHAFYVSCYNISTSFIVVLALLLLTCNIYPTIWIIWWIIFAQNLLIYRLRFSIPLCFISTCCRNGFSTIKASACLAAVIMLFQDRIFEPLYTKPCILLTLDKVLNLSREIHNRVVNWDFKHGGGYDSGLSSK